MRDKRHRGEKKTRTDINQSIDNSEVYENLVEGDNEDKNSISSK